MSEEVSFNTKNDELGKEKEWIGGDEEERMGDWVMGRMREELGSEA